LLLAVEVEGEMPYIVVSIISGFLFGFMDGLINANAYARKLYEAYKPIAKETVNIPVGVIIDLAYGFVMAAIFLMLYESLPGDAGAVKGLSYAVMVWFFRVVMSAATTWMTLRVPLKALMYSLVAGLGEMLVLGLLYGLTLQP
jgi:hypothetical protein